MSAADEKKARAEVARRWTWPHINHEPGDGWQIVGFWPSYHAPYISWGLGFSGWKSAPRSAFVRGGWEFWNPYVCVGRLCGIQRVWCPGEISLPAALVGRWRWLTRPSYRRAMRDEPLIAASRQEEQKP